MLEKYLLLFNIDPRIKAKPIGDNEGDKKETLVEKKDTKKRTRKPQEPEPQNVIDLRSDILKTLVEIDEIASKYPNRRVAIRNRTRESITRLLHYERDFEKLTRMSSDATKLLALWNTSN